MDGNQKGKTCYRAYVQNQYGAWEVAGSDTSLRNLKAFVRLHYGAGCAVSIDKIEHDSGIMNFQPVEVARYTLRK